MADLDRSVENEFGVWALKAVGLCGEWKVVPRRELLKMSPHRPRGREPTGAEAGISEFLGHSEQLGPGFERLVGVEARLFERVSVDPCHHRGQVERERQHLTIRRR